jgi:PAS domain S-box-containing protein
VLYAEQDPLDSDLICRHFASITPFIHIDVVASADEVLRRFPAPPRARHDLQNSYDVLLLAYRLPGMNGLELLKALLQDRALDLPIVFVTSKGDEEIAIQALRLGALDYVSKHEGYLLRLPAIVENTFHRAQLVREQAALKASEELFRGLLNSAPDAMVIVNSTGAITLVNSQTERLFGYTCAELIGQPIEILVPERFQSNHSQYRNSYAAEPHVRPMGVGIELYARHKDGHEFPIEVSLSPLHTATGILISSSIRDVTERKRAEETLKRTATDLMRSNTELEQFAYVASHDLQEPIRMVTSYMQLLQRRYHGQLDAKADLFIGYAVEGATRMHTLINDLLAYSRVGTHGKAFELVDCALVLKQACANLKLAIEESDAMITHDRLPVVRGDAWQLGQLFQNLIGNAIKFCGTEPPRIHVGAEQHGAEWIISVCDNGIGIDSEFAERIFIIFQRLHTRVEYPGTGIGLAICKKIVERHGGRIWVESAVGQGSTFFFTLPGPGVDQP